MKPQILWIDDEPDVLAAASRLSRNESWTLVTAESLSEGEMRLAEGAEFAAVVVDQALADGRGIDWLAKLRATRPALTRILLTGRLDEQTLEDAVNRAGVFRFLVKPWEPSDLILDLALAIEHHGLQVRRAQLVREVSLQNRKLEELTTNLESLVVERTLSAERSKAEAEAKLRRVRNLVRFIKELSTLNSTEELIHLVNRELKGIHELRAPVLGYYVGENKPMLLYFQGKQVVERPVRQVWSQSIRLRLGEMEDQQYLAQEFGRPFAKILAIPLRRASRRDVGAPPSVLFFEHALSDDRVDQLVREMGELIQPLSLALDRILLDYQLKYASLQWEETFDNLQDPIAIVDVDYQIIRANQLFSGAGYQHSCHVAFNDSELVCVGCPLREALKSGRPVQGQVRRGEKIFSVLSYPIRLEGDHVVTNVINHYVDVTRERALQSRLIQNEKMAAIGLLAGNIAHELNNPLTGIRSLAQVLTHELPQGTQTANDLIEVEKAAARSQKIIENLLDFSRGGADEKAIPVNPNDMVLKTLPMLKTAMREHNSEVELTVEQVHVRVEPHLLQQVIFNLVNNACQAMRLPGVVRIETEVVRLSEARQFLMHVSDTGEGIPAELTEKIFEPFFTTKAEGKGTGLGLSISQSVIQNFGGEIRVRNRPQGGAEFTVALPVME